MHFEIEQHGVALADAAAVTLDRETSRCPRAEGHDFGILCIGRNLKVVAVQMKGCGSVGVPGDLDALAARHPNGLFAARELAVLDAQLEFFDFLASTLRAG